MDAGAMGAEIVLSGKIPSSRAKTWRFIDGYLKKCGYISDKYVIRGRSVGYIKAGAIGISVNIMPPGLTLPDDVKLVEQQPVLEEKQQTVEEKKEIEKEAKEKKIEENVKDDEEIKGNE